MAQPHRHPHKGKTQLQAGVEVDGDGVEDRPDERTIRRPSRQPRYDYGPDLADVTAEYMAKMGPVDAKTDGRIMVK